VDELKLQVAVDLDDVVVDFFAGVIDSMYREFGVYILKEDVTSWDDNPVKMFNWKDYGYGSWWDWMKSREWLWAGFQAVPGAIGGIAALRSQGHYVSCVTSKPDWAEHNVWKWLGKWRPGFQNVTIVDIDHPKHTVSDADILVDDKPENIINWVESDDDRLGIIFDQPWNRAVYGERIVRAGSWHGVVETVELLEKGVND
jgi:5'(3')-deoxyribonucleotidase